jgi:hypothetical protein
MEPFLFGFVKNLASKHLFEPVAYYLSVSKHDGWCTELQKQKIAS